MTNIVLIDGYSIIATEKSREEIGETILGKSILGYWHVGREACRIVSRFNIYGAAKCDNSTEMIAYVERIIREDLPRAFS